MKMSLIRTHSGPSKRQIPTRPTAPLAVGLGVGIPVIVAMIVIFYFMYRGKKRHQREEEKEEEDQLHELDDEVLLPTSTHSTPSPIRRLSKNDVQVIVDEGHSNSATSTDSVVMTEGPALSLSLKSANRPQRKKKYYTPAYKQQKRVSSTSLSQLSTQNQFQTYTTTPSNTSIISKQHSLNSSSTHQYPSSLNMNISTHSFIAIPTNLENQEELSRILNGSISMPPGTIATDFSSNTTAASLNSSSHYLHHIPHNHLDSDSSDSAAADTASIHAEAYPLQNNIYDHANEFEIQEEDQYVNEFTNYEENKRAFIQEMRPK